MSETSSSSRKVTPHQVQVNFPSRTYAGYIFDCDGTLAHSMPIHYRAWVRAMKDFGGDFPEDLFYAWGGVPTAEIVRRLNERYGLTMPVDDVVHRKEEYYLKLVHEVAPIEPVLEFARQLRGKAPMAIASGGHRELVQATLTALGALAWFDALVAAEDCERGKPAPDPFLEAARRLGLPPEQCVVFEDSPTGIEAARAAGMDWVHVPSAPVKRENNSGQN